MKQSIVNRRNFLKLGAGVAAAGLASSPAAMATQCASNQTPGQPLGPFFPREQTPKVPIREDQNPETPIYLANDNDLTWVEGQSGAAKGTHCLIVGQLTDKQCQAIKNATIVIWQASSTGLYNHIGDTNNETFQHPVTGETLKREHDPNFQYWGKAVTDDSGRFVFKTIVPGFYPANLESGWYRPPHIHFMVAATGHPQHVTQMYFRSESLADNEFLQELNKRDLLLQSPDMSEEDKEKLLVDFKPSLENGDAILKGRFDITI